MSLSFSTEQYIEVKLTSKFHKEKFIKSMVEMNSKIYFSLYANCVLSISSPRLKKSLLAAFTDVIQAEEDREFKA